MDSTLNSMTDRLLGINKVLFSISFFALGVIASSFIRIHPYVSVLFVIIAFGVISVDKIQNKKVGREVILIFLIFVSLGLGTFRYALKDFHEEVTPVSTGVVISEPEQKENSTRFVMLADNEEKLLVSTGLYSPVKYGDRIEVEGKIEKPGIIENENGREFDYAKYLSKDDIYFVMSFAEVEVISEGNGSGLKHFLFAVKSSVVSKIREIFSEPESSLLAGLIVAGKTAMPRDILDEFRRTGIIHIVVLSGYNITIIAKFIMGFFEKITIFSRVSAILPNRQWALKIATAGSVLGILLFVLMTGAEATVVRASIMVLVVVLARGVGREYEASRALIFAGFLMVVQNPKILVLDASFQLSFLATCGLIYLLPITERWLKRMPNILGRDILATTIATQIAVLPLLIYSMGEVSLVSIPANLFVLAIIPATMLIGFVSALLSYVSAIIALPFSYLTHFLLSWILGVSSFLSNLPLASVSVPVFPFWIVLIVYALLIIFVIRSKSSVQRSAN